MNEGALLEFLRSIWYNFASELENNAGGALWNRKKDW